ncbi:MAG: hypothetical protein KA712_21730 [Myxococcales bacterium]|nr:hypothetical protein [Myxococcales bacterium]
MTAHDCDRTQARLSSLLDDELSEDERQSLLADVQACSRCQQAFNALQTTVGQLSRLRQPAPPTFLSDIQSQIRTRSRGRFFGRKRKLLFGRVPFEWISLVMIVTMLVYYIVTMQSSPTEVTPAP